MGMPYSCRALLLSRPYPAVCVFFPQQRLPWKEISFARTLDVVGTVAWGKTATSWFLLWVRHLFHFSVKNWSQTRASVGRRSCNLCLSVSNTAQDTLWPKITIWWWWIHHIRLVIFSLALMLALQRSIDVVGLPLQLQPLAAFVWLFPPCVFKCFLKSPEWKEA